MYTAGSTGRRRFGTTKREKDRFRSIPAKPPGESAAGSNPRRFDLPKSRLFDDGTAFCRSPFRHLSGKTHRDAAMTGLDGVRTSACTSPELFSPRSLPGRAEKKPAFPAGKRAEDYRASSKKRSHTAGIFSRTNRAKALSVSVPEKLPASDSSAMPCQSESCSGASDS